MKKFVFKSLVAVIVVVAIVKILTPFAKDIGEATNKMDLSDLFNRGSSDIKITNIDLEEQLKSCASLKTAEYAFTSQYHYENDGFLCFTGEECTFEYSGYVEAGIEDLTGVEIRINKKDRLIEVYMPNVEILGIPTIDPDSIEVLDESTGWFSDITCEEYSMLLSECSEHQLDRAQEAGILLEAKTQTTNIVEYVLSSFLENTHLSCYKIAVFYGQEAPDYSTYDSFSKIDEDIDKTEVSLNSQIHEE